MENKKNSLTIVLVVIIAILCLVVGWLLGSKFADKESEILDNPTPDTEEKEELNVVDYINKTFDKNTMPKNYVICGVDSTYGVNKVTLPMIQSNKPGVQNFNNVIKNHYKNALDVLTEEGVNEKIKSFNYSEKQIDGILGSNEVVEYKYSKTEQYISILITKSGGHPCATSYGSTHINSFNYDINNDKYITNTETLSLLGIPKEQVLNAFIEKNPYLSNYESFATLVYEEFDKSFYIYITENNVEIMIENETVNPDFVNNFDNFAPVIIALK